MDLCQVRRGITKYVMDRCDYDATESQIFQDCAIGGIGWFNVRYKFDHETQDGEAVIERVDPFSMYVDPEAHELDYSDAKFLIRAKRSTVPKLSRCIIRVSSRKFASSSAGTKSASRRRLSRQTDRLRKFPLTR